MKNNYNLIAPFYDFICRIVFGNSIVNAQLAYLKQLPKQGRVLFMGGGSGLLLRQLVLLRPQLYIDYVDASSKMIKSSQNKVEGIAHNVHFICGEANAIPSCQYDAVLTFFYLDLFETGYRQFIFKTLNDKLKNKGTWLIADFNIPKSSLQKILEKFMFYFLKLTTRIESKQVENYKALFNRSEFDKLDESEYFSAFIFSCYYRKQVGTVIG